MTGLPIWDAIDPGSSARTCALIGSSTLKGTLAAPDNGVAGRLRTLASSRWGGGTGPILATDFAIVTYTSGGDAWATVASGATGDASPVGGVRSASGSTKIATFTRAMPAGFRIRIVDGTSAAQFAYSIDGGAYTNTTGITYTANNAIKTTADVTTPVTSTLAIRAANAAGASAQVYLLEVEPIESNTAQFINACEDGATASDMSRNTHSYLDAWLTLHTEIDLVVCGFTNDSRFDIWVNAATFRAAFDNLLNACTSIGADLLPLIWFGRGTSPYTTFPLANQDAIRTEVRDLASDNGLPVIDLRDYYSTGEAAFAAGMVMDELGANVHATSTGLDFVADKIWRQINRNADTAAFVRV